MKTKQPQPWEQEDMVMVCQHVLDEMAEPEYNKEDDSYVCTRCRDMLEKKGFEYIQQVLCFVHRSCL